MRKLAISGTSIALKTSFLTVEKALAGYFPAYCRRILQRKYLNRSKCIVYRKIPSKVLFNNVLF